MPTCDCGTCCEQCGHYPECIRHELTNSGMASADGWIEAREGGDAR